MAHQKHPHLAHPQYRPDIDGLRAIAILAVVLFHAFPEIMPGGYIGVDIFFVISGYLISAIIFSSLERDRFSFVVFYARRVQRIFPALILVLVFCLVTGWFVLFPDEYAQLGKHTLAGVGFIQNIILWQESKYFDYAAETKPLLHLWSLAIEEQFYIFWPLLISFVWKRHWNFLRITTVIAAASFTLTIYLVQTGRLSAAFFMTASRLWELMVGGALAYFILHRPHWVEKHKDVQSFFGFFLIIVALFVLNKERDFPGWWALLPTVGAFFVISAGPTSFLNNKILANRQMIWLGLISYPLYLWHWPALVYLKIGFPNITNTMKLAALFAAVLLAWLTYEGIEKPLRHKIRRRASLYILVILLTLTGIAGAFICKFDSLSNPKLVHLGSTFGVDRTKLGYSECTEQFLQNANLGFCNTTSPKSVDSIVIGDSHADDKYFGITKADPTRSWMLLGNNTCPPVLGISVGPVNDCREKFEKIYHWIDLHQEVSTVVLAYFGNYFLTTAYAADHKNNGYGPDNIKIDSSASLPRYDTFKLGMKNAIQRLLRQKKKVVILIDVPELSYLPRDCERHGISCTTPIAEVLARQKQHREMIADLQREFPAIQVFDPRAIFCTSQICSYKIGSTVMYRDSHHLTLNGSELYGIRFIEWLNK